MKRLLLLFIFLWTAPLISGAQTVDLLFQGKGYAPPFYQGRTLWGKQSNIVLLAVPQGLGNPAALDYLWSKNGTVLGNISGVGKNSLVFSDSIFSKPVTIKVEIVRGDEELLAEKSITLLPSSPLLAVYEKNPLYGFVFNRESASGFTLGNGEITLTAFPFFAASQSRVASSLKYSWKSGSSEETKDSVTYRAPQGSSGSAMVTVDFSDTSLVLPAIKKSLLINFANEQ